MIRRAQYSCTHARKWLRRAIASEQLEHRRLLAADAVIAFPTDSARADQPAIESVSAELVATSRPEGESASLLHNAYHSFDANHDDRVTALDALVIVNFLGKNGVSDVDGITTDFFYNVNGDTRVSAVDALQVINELARAANRSEDDQFKIAISATIQFGADETISLTDGSDSTYRLRVSKHDACRDQFVFESNLLALGEATIPSDLPSGMYYACGSLTTSQGHIRPAVNDALPFEVVAVLPSIAVPENQPTTSLLTKVDYQPGPALFSISGGDDAGLFSIAQDTGQLTVQQTLDFENPADLDGDNVYDLQVSVDETGKRTITQAVAITVENENEPPTFTSPNQASVREQTISVLRVAAEDPEGEVVSYSTATPGFEVDSATGSLVFSAPPNFEAPGQVSNQHIVDVTATSGLLSSTQSITVAVSDVDEPEEIDQLRRAQILLMKDYVNDAILPSGLVRDSLILDPNGTSFHPATPDAAGFLLIGLSVLHHLGERDDAADTIIDILKTHLGEKPGVTPTRSKDGFFLHYMDISNGTLASGGWPKEFATIGTALLAAGADFAKNHFAGNSEIERLAGKLQQSVEFDRAINPAMDGSVFLLMQEDGGGMVDRLTRPWNEYMLVVSYATREANANLPTSVTEKWLDAALAPKTIYNGQTETLTDVVSRYLPAFVTQQQHFLNEDFRNNAAFETLFRNQQTADKQYSGEVLDSQILYGLTAGVGVNSSYHADAIENHPSLAFSPEAVAAWGDLEALQEFDRQQPDSTSDRYGMTRILTTDSSKTPTNAGVVDHLFLLFGLAESIDPDFFIDRLDFDA